MSRTRTEFLYERKDEVPSPVELYYRAGPGSVTASGATLSGGNILTVGGTLVNHTVSNPSDGALMTSSQLYTKQVRHRQSGEILATYPDVYSWTRRSVTLVKSPHRNYTVIHYPYDIELYNPDNPRP